MYVHFLVPKLDINQIQSCSTRPEGEFLHLLHPVAAHSKLP